MKFKTNLFALLILFIIESCSLFKNKGKDQGMTIPMPLEEVKVKTDTTTLAEAKLYHASESRINDLLHTKLDVSFDWQKAYLNGKANLTFRPYFYPTDSLTLDAKGFNIHEVVIVTRDGNKSLRYTYDSINLKIALDKTYKPHETYEVFIKYTAKPNELKVKGSAAITADKGLYFINQLGKEKNKPRQIWTQGETEASSAWFPTIDAPNEKTTQEIYITVEKDFVTLSNGLLISSRDNKDGTRTDYWKMTLPHAPYLFMMAVGEFAIIKDKWRNKEINYYVEPEYARYAKQIFGNTPEMIELYSKLLGYDYPWDKYSQVVVRDFVSGAMENTSATIHFEGLQKTSRELLDETYEDIIAHELFHQWFGDVVTTESWSNLPLNESFATYGEYIWNEHKYGRMEADYSLNNDLSAYLNESKRKQEPLIRFHYEDKEDMFDAHSYQKGGRVLHMLRKYIGDEAFYKSLHLYLSKNEFKPVEIHQLRLAFEEVTGEDLNWFFNQWFLTAGHPKIIMDYTADAQRKEVKVNLKQQPSISGGPIYTLPMFVDIYSDGKVERRKIIFNQKEQEFTFKSATPIDLVNADAEKMLLAEVTEKKPEEYWVRQYKTAPLYMDKYTALKKIADMQHEDPRYHSLLIETLGNNFWAFRQFAVEELDLSAAGMPEAVKTALKQLALKDDKSAVREAAIIKLSDIATEDIIPVIRQGINDSSYTVAATSLYSYAKLKPDEALILAKQFESEKNDNVILALAAIYAEKGNPEHHNYFLRLLNEKSGYALYSILNHYAAYLQRMPVSEINKTLPALKDIAINNNTWFIRYAAMEIFKKLKEKAKEENNTELLSKISGIITEIKAAETNENLKMMYRGIE